MDYPKFIVSNQKGESISVSRPEQMFCQSWSWSKLFAMTINTASINLFVTENTQKGTLTNSVDLVIAHTQHIFLTIQTSLLQTQY